MAKTIKISYTKSCQNAFEKAIEKATIDFIKELIKHEIDFKETTLEQALELINFETKGSKKSKSNSKKKKNGKFKRPAGRAKKGMRWSYSKGVWLEISEHGIESDDEDIIGNNVDNDINEESKDESNNSSTKKPKKRRIIRKKKDKKRKVNSFNLSENESSDNEDSDNESSDDFSSLVLNNNNNNNNNNSDSDNDNHSDGDIVFSDGEF